MIRSSSYLLTGLAKNDTESFIRSSELLNALDEKKDIFLTNNNKEMQKVFDIKRISNPSENYYIIKNKSGYETVISGNSVWIEAKPNLPSERLWYTGDLLYETWEKADNTQKKFIQLKVPSIQPLSVRSSKKNYNDPLWKKSIRDGVILASTMYNESTFSFSQPKINILYDTNKKTKTIFENTGIELIFSLDTLYKMKSSVIGKSIKSETYCGKELVQGINKIFTPAIIDTLFMGKDYGFGLNKEMDEVMYNILITKLPFYTKYTLLQKLIALNSLAVGDEEAEIFKVKDELMALLLINLSFQCGNYGKYEYNNKERCYYVDLSIPVPKYDEIADIKKLSVVKEDCIDFKIDRDEFICDAFILSKPH